MKCLECDQKLPDTTIAHEYFNEIPVRCKKCNHPHVIYRNGKIISLKGLYIGDIHAQTIPS
jgi:hypothetical protein